MTKLLSFAVSLCGLFAACSEKDTAAPIVWRRTVEPRLSSNRQWQPCTTTLRPGRVVAAPDCGPTFTPATPPARCPTEIATHANAVEVLLTEPHCTDVAITALERFARADSGALSDVAAAYYLRAQREDDPSDLLRALEAAQDALIAAPRYAPALFNRALAEEALGLRAEALATWDELLKIDRTEWGAEGRKRRDRLREPLPQWSENQAQLLLAMRAGDKAKVAQLIKHFPTSAMDYFEEKVLPQRPLAEIRVLASELSQLTGDRYPLDVAEAVARTNDSREGYVRFAEARKQEINFGSAEKPYASAAGLLGRDDSPLRYRAEIGYAVSRAPAPGGLDDAAAALDRAENGARKSGYGQLLARVQSSRAYVLGLEDRRLEALAQYDAALERYIRLRDFDNVARMHTRRAGDLRTMGQKQLAWREALLGMRHIESLVKAQQRHGLLGETAKAAFALGHPRTALIYQNTAIRLIEDSVRTESSPNGRRNLSIALRERAAIEVRLERFANAKADLEKSMGLSKEGSANVLRVTRAREREVRGQSLLPSNAAGAEQEFTAALALIAEGEFHTVRAAMLAQRADARRSLGKRAEAEQDLRAALDELRTEESKILEARKPGEREELWTPYFSRFQDTYEALIRQLIEEGKAEEAFLYAERQRAFEPIALILERDVAPAAFRRLTRNALTPAQVQSALSPGTFLLEFSVLEDRIYTWIVSRDRFELLTQRVRRDDVERWTAALQRAVRRRDPSAFDLGLNAPYDKLLAEPLAAIARMPDGEKPKKLVIVPDGAMHGLPFPALRNSDTKRHLIQDVPIEIAGSATLYLYSLLRDAALSSQDEPSVFAFGDPAFNEQLGIARGYPRLPGAQREARSIHELYAPHSALRIDTAATLPELLRLAGEHTVVHLAAHAIVSPAVPSQSLLLLAPSAQHSGAVDAKTLLTRLEPGRTRLFVLSSCSSAGGLPVGPEGVGPLVRPLMTAGIPAVIGSLWDVDDATAVPLLVSFHRHYRQGSEAAVALQSAQVELLRDNQSPAHQSGLAWGGFQVIGHTASPFASRAKQEKEKPP